MSVVSYRLGHWLPQDQDLTRNWLNNLIKEVDKAEEKPLKQELRELQTLIQNDVSLKMLFMLMFKEGSTHYEAVPAKPPYNRDPTQEPQVRDYMHMLKLLDHIMDSAPLWDVLADQVGIIGFPVNAILDWPMCTSSGNTVFLRRDVNEQWTKILNRWAVYMGTPSSAKVLNTADGWLSDVALKELEIKGNNGVTAYTFDQLYICDKSAENYGFESWDNFFVREFRPDMRPLGAKIPTQQGNPSTGLPIGGPDVDPDAGALIYNACESTPIYLRRHSEVNERATFWLKGQPYSLADMLDQDPSTPDFVEGTVYQAFLSALSYHRWHSPVSGTIKRAFNIPGTYFSANYFEGFANPPDEGGPDEVAPNNSQAYLAQVATRAVILIDADDEDIGLMGFVAIGMCECSSNQITVVEGQHVAAGEQIGMFHFGGSTHCLLFRKGVDVVFLQEPNQGSKYDPPLPYNMPLRSTIAVVKKPAK